MFPKIILCFVSIALLAACAAPTENPAPTGTLTATMPPTQTPTFTPTVTLTPTPEAAATATPEPTVELPTISFINGKGETITIPEFSGEDAFDKSMMYVAANTIWFDSSTSRDELMDFALNNSDRNAYRDRFKGVPGWNPEMRFNGLYPVFFSGDRFILYNAELGKGTLVIFMDENRKMVGIYVEMNIPDFNQAIVNSPIMSDLHPQP